MAEKKTVRRIHDLMAALCLSVLEDGVWVEDGDGIARRILPSASMLAQINKFLAENPVEMDEDDAVKRDLAKELQDMPDFDNVHHIRHERG